MTWSVLVDENVVVGYSDAAADKKSIADYGNVPRTVLLSPLTSHDLSLSLSLSVRTAREDRRKASEEERWQGSGGFCAGDRGHHLLSVPIRVSARHVTASPTKHEVRVVVCLSRV